MSRVADMLKTLVCLLLAMASMSHDQRESSEENMRCHSKVGSSFYKTREGNQIPRSELHCEIKSEQLPVKYHFDIASVVQSRVSNGTLSYLDMEIECNSPIQLRFTNLHSLKNKNILSNLTFVGPCIVSVQNLAIWSNATDLLSVEIGADINGQSPKLVNEKGTVKSSIQTLTAIAFYSSTPRGVLDTLSIAENGRNYVVKSLARKKSSRTAKGYASATNTIPAVQQIDTATPLSLDQFQFKVASWFEKE